MGLAIFDIDGTLLTGPSTEKRFFLHLVRAGRLGPRQVLAFAWFLLRWTPRFGRHVFKKNKAYLAWLAEDDVRRLAADWVRSALREAWFEPCVERLHRHREAGDVLVLMSGTPQFIAEAIGDVLGVKWVLASECSAERGLSRARPPCRHPFREEKAALMTALAREHGFAPAEITAYGDSIYDLPLFEAVGTPVAVRPDEELAEVAEASAWEVIGAVRRSWWRTLLPGIRPVSPPAGSPGRSSSTRSSRPSI